MIKPRHRACIRRTYQSVTNNWFYVSFIEIPLGTLWDYCLLLINKITAFLNFYLNALRLILFVLIVSARSKTVNFVSKTVNFVSCLHTPMNDYTNTIYKALCLSFFLIVMMSVILLTPMTLESEHPIMDIEKYEYRK